MIPLVLVALLSRSHDAAARVAAHVYGVDAEVLLAIAEHETHWDASLRNGYACGPMQVVPVDVDGRWSEARCLAMATPLVGYLEGAAALRERLRVSRGDLRAALRLYGCGWEKDAAGAVIRPAQIPPTCHGFDGYVLSHAERRRRANDT